MLTKTDTPKAAPKRKVTAKRKTTAKRKAPAKTPATKANGRKPTAKVEPKARETWTWKLRVGRLKSGADYPVQFGVDVPAHMTGKVLTVNDAANTTTQKDAA